MAFALSTGICYAANWTPVTTITGTSTQTTDYFNVPTNEWRIVWSYTPSSAGGDYAIFSIFTYPKGETAVYTDYLLKNGRTETSGTTYIHQGTKEYYMKISSANIDSYSIRIEADSPTPTPSPTVPDFSTSLLIATLIAIVTASAAVIKVKTKKIK